MPQRVKLLWLVLLAAFGLALAHGFAGAATHLPHHPDHALVAKVASLDTAQAGDTEPHHHGHGGTACKMMTGSGAPQFPPAAEGPAISPEDTPTALSCSAAVPARAPPKPSLAALSVMRI